MMRALSFLVLISIGTYYSIVLQYILYALIVLNTWMNGYLDYIFPETASGIMLRQSVALMLVPLCLILPIAWTYQFIRKQPLPYVMHIAWILWFLTELSRLIIQ